MNLSVVWGFLLSTGAGVILATNLLKSQTDAVDPQQIDQLAVVTSSSPTPLPSPSPSPSPQPSPTAAPEESEIVESPPPTQVPEPIEEQVGTLETDYGVVEYVQVIEKVWATSYDSTCPGCSDTTATGMKQGYGVVAVDPKVIPLYSRIYVPGYGIGVAGDVGGAVKGNKIDLGFDSLNGQWAAHYVDVYLLAD